MGIWMFEFHIHSHSFKIHSKIMNAVNGMKFDYLNDDVKSWRTRLLNEKKLAEQRESE